MIVPMIVTPSDLKANHHQLASSACQRSAGHPNS
jgi:hypothetical protein